MKEKRYTEKHKLIAILILLSFNINIAQNKVIVPTTGTITFKEKEIIHDFLAYKEGTKKMMVSMLKKNLENSIPKDEEFSITQLEYNVARRLNIDVLVFMLEEQASWPRKFDELDTDPQVAQCVLN